MTAEPTTECFLDGTDRSNGRSLVHVTFQTKQVIEMRERGMDHPYRYRDTTEGMARSDDSDHRRHRSSCRLNGKRPAKYIFTLQHVTYEAFLARTHVLFKVSNLPRRVVLNSDEMTFLGPILAPRLATKFDPSLLVDFREKLLLDTGRVVNRIEPLLKYPGCLMLTTLRLYFQPAQLNHVFDPVLTWKIINIEQVYTRRYLLQPTGFEISLRNGDSYFFSLQSQTERNHLYALLVSQPPLEHCRGQDLRAILSKWQRRELSNFEYLQYLNNASGRTPNDLTQYPVFPWILRDYTSATLRLADPTVYRDLSQPIGALNPKRLEYYKARYKAMLGNKEAEGMPPPFLYGTHYSTPGYVLYYLVRKVPAYMLSLQSGKFDAPDRLFRSIKETWDGCLSNATDVKELIPEFFDTALPADDWLRNNQYLDLGTTQQLDRVDAVELPPWAHGNPNEFVQMNRAALESDYVSDHLHHWIDLIFGYKQQGDEAVKANNVFYYLSYEGSVDIDTIEDPVQKSSIESQIHEFGQTPKKLFSSPHPSRNEGDKNVQVATPDLLLSPDVRRIAINPLSNAPHVRRHKRKDSQQRACGASTASKDDVGHDVPSRQKSTWFQCRLLCFHTPWNCLSRPLQRHCTRLWGSTHCSGKAWKWSTRLSNQSTRGGPSWHWTQLASSRRHTGEVTSTILSKDTSFLVTTSKDTSLTLSSTRDMTRCHTVAGTCALSCCALSPDESLVFVGSWDNRVSMHSRSSGRVLHHVVAHADGISAMRVMPDRLLTSSWDSTIKLWRYTPRCIVPTPLETFLECNEAVMCLAVSRDGHYGAAGTRTGFVYLFDLWAARLYHCVRASSRQGGGIASIVFTPDDTSYVCVTVQNEVVQLTLCGEVLWTMDIQTAGQVRCFDTDGHYAVGGTTSGQLLFWNLHARAGLEVVCEIPRAHDASISSLTVSLSGSVLVSGAMDGSVSVWKLEKKMPLPRTQASRRKVPLNYGSISTPRSSYQTFSNTKQMPPFYTFPFVAHFAEAGCCLEI